MLEYNNWFAMRVIKLILISVCVSDAAERMGNVVADVMIYATDFIWLKRRKYNVSIFRYKVHQPRLIRMLTESPSGYRLLCLCVFFFYRGANKTPPATNETIKFNIHYVQLMPNKNRQRTNTHTHKEKTHTPKWISITHRYARRKITHRWFDDKCDGLSR